jgi:UDP-3-O-acyl-N-acetylglucosamine deacetylase
MSHPVFGTLLAGEPAVLEAAHRRFAAQTVDWDLTESAAPAPIRRVARTLDRPVTVQGPGTFFGRATRTITFSPTDREGWWFQRTDHPECLPVKVSIQNVWTVGQIVSNIVLRSGPPQNYIRLVEHIIALRMGFDVDNLMIGIDSGDPPLFDDGSLPLVEKLEEAGRRDAEGPVRYWTVKERVTVGSPEGKFLIFDPVRPDRLALDIDCAVDFPTAIGKQRIRFPLNAELFRLGSIARTNSTYAKKLYCQTIGRLFADVRNLGYTDRNVLIAGRRRYYNPPRLPHEGKALEAVWHRAVLDLLAAIALLEEGRLLGTITSYRAGHSLDVTALRLLYQHDLLREVTV